MIRKYVQLVLDDYVVVRAGRDIDYIWTYMVQEADLPEDTPRQLLELSTKYNKLHGKWICRMQWVEGTVHNLFDPKDRLL